MKSRISYREEPVEEACYREATRRFFSCFSSKLVLEFAMHYVF
jgi:hypothetical protein